MGGRWLASARRHAERPALVAESNSYSYRSLAAAALGVAGALRKRAEFAEGIRVALLAGNTPEYLAGFYGILLAGGVAVPLPEQIERQMLDRVLADSGACLLLTAPGRRYPAIQSAMDSEELDLAKSPAIQPPVAAAGADPRHSAAMILYTSGSTGQPKGVLLSHGNLLSNAESILAYLPIGPHDRALAVLPFCHAFGNSVVQTHLLTGGTLVVDGSTTFPNSMVDALERHDVNSFAGVPEIYNGLLACSDLGRRPLPSLRYMTVAGAALHHDSACEMARRIKPAHFYVMYGQSEATARLAYLPSEQLHRRRSSIGLAIPGVELEVRDEQGRTMAVGATGELCARGANVMLGYWRNPQATNRVLKDGWLHTGDLAKRDADGFLYVSGRRQDEVKIRGLKVAPGAVAETLSRWLPNCRICVVPFEINHTVRLALFVETNAPRPSLQHEIRQVCADALTQRERPSHIEIVDQLPLTPSLKIDRKALEKRATEGAASKWGSALTTKAEELSEVVAN
ncbi:MAG: class I adenylate-forming enzyme family protein [Planctomycetota bacterium]